MANDVSVFRPSRGRAEVMRVRGSLAAIPVHVHASWCLLAVTGGARTLLCGGRAFALGEGRAALIAPGVAHSCPAGGGECSWLAACFALADAPPGSRPDERPRGVSVFDAPGLAAKLGDALRWRDVAFLTRLCDEAVALADSVGWDAPAANRRPLQALPAVAKARAILDDPASLDVPLCGVARLSGASLFHLSRRFKLETGLTPHEYRTLTRLRQARAFLAAGASPAEAAAECGFFDQSHLNLRFGKYMGMTPGIYRRATR